MGTRIDLISVSGGKDSQAILELALERGANIHAVFADTGNEHELTYEHLDTIERETGVTIQRVKADFSRQIAGKREFIVNGRGKRPSWAESGVDPELIASAVEMLHPTGNPFLDLCIWKGRFPSTKARFCTEELKSRPIEQQVVIPLLKDGKELWSWQGVRADESASRAKLPEQEWVDPGLMVYRPILHWTAEQVFAYLAERGRTVNPLYTQGMGRVGCMPCIMCRKGELRAIADRFPEVIERIERWERLVGQCSKIGAATMFSSAGLEGGLSPEDAVRIGNIRARVEWSRTTHGGKQHDLYWLDEDATQCSSLYGLCE